MDSTVLKSFLPEIFISIFILFQLVINVLILYDITNSYPTVFKEVIIQTLFMLFCLLFLLWNNKIEGFFHNFLFLNDLSTKTVKFISILIFIFSFFSLFRSFIYQNLNFFEYFVILNLSILSMLLLISASDFLSVYLVIEMQSLSFYILSCFKRNSAFSTEAGLKYFISGSFISGVFLFGCTIIFSFFSTLNFNALNLLVSIPFYISNLYFVYPFLFLGVSFIIFFFLFKVSSVPFHFWSIDVYEGSPLCSTIVFSILPKLALFYMFSKCISIFSSFTQIEYILLTSSILSIIFGSFFALTQKRFKRFIIFSSIAQTGFLVIALSNPCYNSLISFYFFLFIYLLTSVLIWTNISLFGNFKEKMSYFNNNTESPLFLSSISNFFKTNRIWSLSNVLVFFSLGGIPPLVGFFAKIFILYSLVESKNLIYSFIMIVLSAISVSYYLRIIKIIFFEKIIKKLDCLQISLSDSFLVYEYFIISLILFLLFFLFFSPSLLIIVSHLIVYNFSFF